ncbi:MAG TPA: LysR substrate-binding domain-containing protein [Burkholderiaceae bacterium]|nr:LysR substrate-binding domain-containing protein [Burkholderiaceae bacterium]
MPSSRIRPVPLAGLRGFEAAARLLSFTLAADELGLTQSAVSRQIRGLEQQVGRALFRRGVRSLALTEAGERLQRAVQAGLQEIDRGVDDVRGHRRRRRLSLTTAASLASLLLVPRLADFSRQDPTVDIRIDASDTVRDLEREGIDLAIRYFPHDRAPRGLRLLHEERLVPVMSPRLERRIGPIAHPSDLAAATLLVDDDGHWQRWYAAAGLPVPDATRLTLTFTHQALDAALREQGAMLAPTIYVREHLARGSLVAPLGRPVPSGFGYYLIVNRDSARLKHVNAFADWLVRLFDEADAG